MKKNAVIGAHGPRHARINGIMGREGWHRNARPCSAPFPNPNAPRSASSPILSSMEPQCSAGVSKPILQIEPMICQKPVLQARARELRRKARRPSFALSRFAAPDKTQRPSAPLSTKPSRNLFSECIRSRPDLALMVAVAKLGTDYGQAYGCVALSITENQSFEARSELLKRIVRLRFHEALAICANAPLVDLSVAFTELVARSIRIASDSVRGEIPLSDLTPLATALSMRGAPFSCPARSMRSIARPISMRLQKGAALAVVDAIGTPAINRADKKAAIADYVAADATKKKWLPAPLAAWVETPATSPELPRRNRTSGRSRRPWSRRSTPMRTRRRRRRRRAMRSSRTKLPYISSSKR